MPKMADRIQETTITGGTGTLTLAGAVSGYLAFASGFSVGDILFYTIDNGAGEWEIGIGTLLTTSTLSRTTIIASSNSGALVSFSSGTKRVFCSAPTRSLLPDQTSKTGYILTTDGINPSWTANLDGVAIGAISPASGTFTTLSASSTVSGTGFSTYLASPPAIGGTAPAAGSFTTLGATGNVTLGDASSDTITLNGYQFNAAGAAATPSISRTGDTNTGLWFPAADTLAASTAGTERLRIDASGNLGLGVTPVASDFAAIQGASGCALFSHGPFISLSANSVYRGRQTYITPGKAALLGLANGIFTWYTGPEWDGTGTSPDLSVLMSLAPDVLNVYGTVIAHATNTGLAYRMPSGSAFRSNAAGSAAFAYFDLGTIVFRGGNGENNASIFEISGNLGILGRTFGAGAIGVLSIASGAPPSTGPADTIQLYSTDLSAGNTMLSLFTEGTCVNSNATAAATHRIAIRVNGTVYYLLANTSA